MPRATGPTTARRILVYGVTGSGKSTAAARIAAATRLPCHLADELTWEPHWTPVPEDEQRRRFASIAARDAWVLDTAYSSWLDVVLPRVELVVALDYPRWLSLQRLLRRTAARVVDRAPVRNGNTETLRTTFARDSIIWLHFRSFARKRQRIAQWTESPGGVPVLRFRHPRELERWIDSLRR